MFVASRRVASYRFRATFARRWGGYLSLFLLIGLVGGVSMGAMAGARRTDSSFPTFVASTNPETLQDFTGIDNPALGFTAVTTRRPTRRSPIFPSSCTSRSRSATTATSISRM